MTSTMPMPRRGAQRCPTGVLAAVLSGAPFAWWLLLSPAPAQAQAVTCNLGLAAMPFGTVTATDNQPHFATTDLQLSCNGMEGQRINICTGIGPGEAPIGPNGPRKLFNDQGRLDFDIFTTAAHATRYENGVDLVANLMAYTIPAGGSGTKIIRIYGRIPVQSGAPAGFFSSYFEINMRYGNPEAYSTCTGASYSIASYGVQVSATNEAGCTVSTAPVAFGTVGSLDTMVDAQGAIELICTPGTAYAVGLGGGANGTAGGGGIERSMANGGNRIAYGLFRDAARTQAWFDDPTNDLNGASSMSGASQTIPVYGRVPAQATPLPGVYTDNVVVTISY